ncbi:hypothetical protein HPB50_024667 [Hyalomma asiaticum]|uniref:Uncharacterized protein n=1 Tax=Hyalomma asiaticum TaxID=266040 RepID=A0ACB7RL61_HYAAI|nr:hypothetical protein HPB50_024667 [Hyalomma asiaticum]
MMKALLLASVMRVSHLVEGVVHTKEMTDDACPPCGKEGWESLLRIPALEKYILAVGHTRDKAGGIHLAAPTWDQPITGQSRCPYASELRDELQGDYERQDPSEDSAASSCATKVDCDADKPFREPDGTCNNLAHPNWGRAGSCMRRELPPAYSDGVSAARLSVTGNPLPSARLVSLTIHPQRRTDDRHLTNMAVMFGQLLTHDISHSPPVLLPELSTNLGKQSLKWYY